MPRNGVHYGPIYTTSSFHRHQIVSLIQKELANPSSRLENLLSSELLTFLVVHKELSCLGRCESCVTKNSSYMSVRFSLIQTSGLNENEQSLPDCQSGDLQMIL